MKLGEFIDKFSHNNLIRLHYKNKGGYICVLDDFDKEKKYPLMNGEKGD